MNTEHHKSQCVLVTGASGGLGQAIARRLAVAGFSLALHYHNNESAVDNLLEDLLPPKIGTHRKIQFAANDSQMCQKVINDDIAKHGAYYGVVCNAGIIRDAAFPSMMKEDWDIVLRTNLDGFYNVLHPTIMPMVREKKGGRIVTIASVSGIMGNRGQTNYSASKGGLIAAGKSLALELGKRQITVNCVAPGIIETEMTEDLDKSMLSQLVPLRRAGKAEEVAGVVNFLLSDEASYITRQVISVNGGMC